MTTTVIEFNPISLSDRIKNAESNDELWSLEVEGHGYRYASDKTRHRWSKYVSIRRTELLKIDKKSDPKGKTAKERQK